MRPRAWMVGVAAAAAYALLLGAYVKARFQGDATGLLFVSPVYAPLVTECYGGPVHVQPSGYDGQFAFLVACDPLGRGRGARALDLPAYRYGRILFPALGRLVAFGVPRFVPVAFVAINVLAIAAGTFLLARWAEARGRSPLFGLAFAAAPGILIAAMRSLPEPLAAALLVAGLFWHERGKQRAAWASWAGAVLAREASFLPLVGLAGWALMRGDGRGAVRIASTVTPYLIWQAHVFAVFGTFSFTSTQTGLGWPFAGLLDKARTLASAPRDPQWVLEVTLLASLLVGAAWLVVALVASRDGRLGALLAPSLLALVATSPFVLEGYWSFLRVHALIGVLTAVGAVSGERSPRAYLGPLLLLSWGSLLVSASFVLKRFFA